MVSSTRRTAGCGPACPVVWQGRVGDHFPYADCQKLYGCRRFSSKCLTHVDSFGWRKGENRASTKVVLQYYRINNFEGNHRSCRDIQTCKRFAAGKRWVPMSPQRETTPSPPFLLNSVDRLGRKIDPAVLSVALEIGARSVAYAEKLLGDPALAVSFFQPGAATVSQAIQP